MFQEQVWGYIMSMKHQLVCWKDQIALEFACFYSIEVDRVKMIVPIK